MAEPNSTEPWQLLVHPAATDGLLAFLRSRGLELVRWHTGEDETPLWMMTPSDDLVHATAAPSPEPAVYEPEKGDRVTGRVVKPCKQAGKDVTGTWFRWGTEKKVGWIDDGIGEFSTVWPVDPASVRPATATAGEPRPDLDEAARLFAKAAEMLDSIEIRPTDPGEAGRDAQ